MSNPFKESSVASRFVSQGQLTEAQKKREQDLKDAYARIGQEPPPGAKAEEEYDPRTLYEKLQANKDAKQEKHDETWKLSNQFRGIDEGESEFLAEVAKEKRDEERKKRQEEREQLEAFRRAAQEASPPPRATAATISPPPPKPNESGSSPPSGTSKPASSKANSKRKRDGSALGIKKKKT